jgi:hypothetical protein
MTIIPNTNHSEVLNSNTKQTYKPSELTIAGLFLLRGIKQVGPGCYVQVEPDLIGKCSHGGGMGFVTTGEMHNVRSLPSTRISWQGLSLILGLKT